MNCEAECKRWVTSFAVNEYTKADAILMLDDKEKLEACFGSTLEFGTGGLRGIMGAGTNRMNDRRQRDWVILLSAWAKRLCGAAL